MASYVVYGQRSAVAVHRGFSCTSEELPIELRRVAGEQGLRHMTSFECVATPEAADKVALAYCLEKLREYPLTSQELRWINEGAAAAMRE
jgi:hypothetical protein